VLFRSPYGHRLLGIDIDTSLEFEREISKGCELIKPGWVRVSFNYFITEAVFQFIVDAVHAVANDGWRLLPSYRYDMDSGLWEHRDGRGDPPLSLSEIDYDGGAMHYTVEPHHDADSVLADYLEEAKEIFAESHSSDDLSPPDVSIEFESLRWFPLPHEIEVLNR
jgi:hypothetical protein